MLLQLQLQTAPTTDTSAAPNVDAILQDIYAFIPSYRFTHIGGGVLQTIIDTSVHDLTVDQIKLVLSGPHHIDVLLPPDSTVPAPVPSTPAA